MGHTAQMFIRKVDECHRRGVTGVTQAGRLALWLTKSHAGFQSPLPKTIITPGWSREKQREGRLPPKIDNEKVKT